MPPITTTRRTSLLRSAALASLMRTYRWMMPSTLSSCLLYSWILFTCIPHSLYSHPSKPAAVNAQDACRHDPAVIKKFQGGTESCMQAWGYSGIVRQGVQTWTSNIAVGSITSPVRCCRKAAAFFLASSFTAAHSARNAGSSAAALRPVSCGRSLHVIASAQMPF